MVTINISLPEKLKEAGDNLVSSGLYVSFSDLVRDSLRKSVEEKELDRIYLQAKKDEKEGKATILRNKKDIDNYFKSL